ncbi:hypothetical protein B1A_14879, partial [mine drainage metagenome]
DTLGEALLNSWLGVNPNHIPTKPAIIYGESSIKQLSAAAKTIGKQLDAYTISDYAVEGAEQISKAKALEKIGNNDIGIVMTDNDMSKRDFDLRRRTVDLNIPLVLNGRLAARLAEAFAEADKYKEVREMKEYY